MVKKKVSKFFFIIHKTECQVGVWFDAKFAFKIASLTFKIIKYVRESGEM